MGPRKACRISAGVWCVARDREWWWIAAAAAGILLAGNRNMLMAFTIKNGVYGTLQDVMKPALDAVAAVWSTAALGPPVITSIEDGDHLPNSKHYQGLAVDIRLNNIAPGLHDRLRTEVARLAGPAFDVIHEYHGTDRDHLHIEFDPK